MSSPELNLSAADYLAALRPGKGLAKISWPSLADYHQGQHADVLADLRQREVGPEILEDESAAALRDLAAWVIQTGAGTATLEHRLATLWEERHTVVMHRYPLCAQLGAQAHFESFLAAYLALIVTEGDDAARAWCWCIILGIARSLYRQAEHFIVHNIFTAGSFGLFLIARRCPEFTEAPDWDARAVERLAQDLRRSYYADGGHKERNWGYGAHNLRRQVEAWQLAQRTGGYGEHEASIAEDIRRAFRFYAKTLGPRGHCPGLGDEGLRDMGYMLERAQASGLFPEGTPRDLGVDRASSCYLLETGIVIMRDGDAPDSTFAYVNTGEFAGWHSHFDLLSLNLWARGKILLEEVPRFGTYDHPLDPLTRAPGAHNQLLVDGFFYDSRPLRAENVQWQSNAETDHFSACHRAYRIVPQDEHRPYLMSGDLTVHRQVIFAKTVGYLLVVDSVTGDHGAGFNRAVTQHWHSPHGFEVLGPRRARTSGEAACLLAWSEDSPIRRLETASDFLPEDIETGTHAPIHDQWQHLKARAWHPEGSEQILRLVTVLLTFTGVPPELEVVADGRKIAVTLGQETLVHYV